MAPKKHSRHGGRVSRPRLVLFAFGDFAFNLFWQSVMLFLLFYYSDALNLPIGVAATTYMAASIWDGIANLAAGILVDRNQDRVRYGPLLIAGSVPLSLTFVLAYLPPAGRGVAAIATVFAAHLLFRTAYAAVNVPYLAMTARISSDPEDRAFVAGMRMLFGTSAAITVALCTVPIGRWLMGNGLARAYFGAAIVFATLSAMILAAVGFTYRETVGRTALPAGSIGGTLRSLLSNRSFVVLNAAAMAMIVATTVLSKSVLYYFKYLFNDPHAGEIALASMGLVSGIAIPFWMLAGRFVSLRALWLIACTAAILGLLVFSAVPFKAKLSMQFFLIGMQVVNIGLNFVFWAMLPNTIEYGERVTGVHVEGAVFGMAALLQRVANGIATAVLGWSFASAGYVANVRQSAATMTAMRETMGLVPAVFLALSCVAMSLNPLGRERRRSRDQIEAAVDPIAFS